jgi:hypothetical protein
MPDDNPLLPAITVDDLKAHLNITFDTDDDLLAAKIEAAAATVENYTGYIVDNTSPAPVLEAVRQFAAHLYENREPVLVGVNAQPMPLGVYDMLQSYRKWVF